MGSTRSSHQNKKFYHAFFHTVSGIDREQKSFRSGVDVISITFCFKVPGPGGGARVVWLFILLLFVSNVLVSLFPPVL